MTLRRTLARTTWVSALLLSGCAGAGPLEFHGPVGVPEGARSAPDLDVPNFVEIEQGVAIGGQPVPEALARARELGYRTVVNLRTHAEGAEMERRVADELRLAYVNVPVNGDDLAPEHADALAGVLERADAYPVLIHCRSGGRAGALWAVYVARHRGVSVDDALAAGERAGMRHPKLRQLVERLLRPR